MKRISLFLILAVIFSLLMGCGSKNNNTVVTPGAKPIDPSGNWAMSFTDASNNKLLMSELFSQTGSVVTGLNLSAFGNPAPFSCVPFSGAFANGQVLNVSQFSGDINTSFGNIHFTSTLNDAGTHASGTYTLTGNCWGVAASGTFSADEIPSASGAWSGSIACTANCPTGSTSGAITATITQDDATGAVTGAYSVTGLPAFTTGTISGDQFAFLSGASWQDHLTDQDGNTFTVAGGPFSGTSAGLGLDRSFSGQIRLQQSNNPSISDSTYTISMSH